MPKTQEQCNLIKEKREETLFKASLFLFAKRGYNAVTMDEIAIAANCSHGLIYHYFPNKDQLFLDLMEKYVIPKNREIIKDVKFDKPAKEVLQNLMDAYLSTLKSDDDEKACVIFLLLKLRLEAQYIPKPKIKNRRKRIFDWIYDVIERGKREGDFQNIDGIEATIAIHSMFTGLSYYRINLGHEKFCCPKSEVIMNMLLKEGGNHEAKN